MWLSRLSWGWFSSSFQKSALLLLMRWVIPLSVLAKGVLNMRSIVPRLLTSKLPLSLPLCFCTQRNTPAGAATVATDCFGALQNKQVLGVVFSLSAGCWEGEGWGLCCLFSQSCELHLLLILVHLRLFIACVARFGAFVALSCMWRSSSVF